MKTKIQDFLASGFKNLNAAQTELRILHGIKPSIDTLILDDSSTEMVWSYDLKSKKNRKFCRIENEANAMLIGTGNTLVSCAFPRFYSLYNQNSPKINWNTAFAELKSDGVLVLIYNFNNQTFIQTRESATASNLIPGTDETYYHAVKEVLSKKFGHPFDPFDPGAMADEFVWVFEFVSPKNNTVIKYKKDDLVLLSIIKRSLGQVELKNHLIDSFAEEHRFTRPKNFIVNSEEDAVLIHNRFNDPYGPGVVITDSRKNRVQLVSKTFKIIEKLTNPYVSEKQIAAAALTGLADKLAVRFEKFADLLLLFDTTIHEIAEHVDDFWTATYGLPSKKVFASKVKGYSISNLLFNIWSGKTEDFGGVLSCLTPEFVIKETRRRHTLSYNEIHKKLIKLMEVSSNV